MGGADVFDFAFRKGEVAKSLKDLEGKTVVLGSAGWQSITDPMLKAAGVDITKIKYVDAGWPTWGTALAQGKGDAALTWLAVWLIWPAPHPVSTRAPTTTPSRTAPIGRIRWVRLTGLTSFRPSSRRAAAGSSTGRAGECDSPR